jgi:hypothetical protein
MTGGRGQVIGAAALLTPAQAVARARSTGRPVTVTSLTTPTSQTTATAGGKFTVTESLVPVRAWRHGRWLPLDPALHRTADGRLSPAVTTITATLSDGGTGPLAVMASYGRTLSLSWPTALPVPTVSGATATYPGVPMAGAKLMATVDSQGGVSTVIEVDTPAAAASPALASLTLTASAPGLTASADSAGDLKFRASPAALPVFTAPAPRIWDSTRLPSGTATTADPASGTVIAARSGLPATSTAGGPGAAAHVSTVPETVSGAAITMSPPASALTGPGTVYPVYIDPEFTAGSTRKASAWTEIQQGKPGNTGNWMESGCLNGHGGPCLQVGYCDPNNIGPCNGIGVARTMIRLPVPDLPSDSTVASANLYLEDVWTADCAATPLELWTTPAISDSTDWTNGSHWGALAEEEKFNGFGNPCGPGYSANDVVFGTDSGTKKGVTITGGSAAALTETIQDDIAGGFTNQTFGLRAADESTSDGTAWLQWRQFMNRSDKIELQFTYYNPPNTPSSMGSNPGGTCHTSAASEAQIGNDDVYLYARASDPDHDPGLTTTFKIYAVDTGALVDTLTVSGTGNVRSPLIPRATIQGWQANGNTTAYRYHFTAQTTNQDGQNGPASGPCYFYYNPSGPAAPVVTGFPGSVQLGQSVNNVTFAPPPGTTCPGPSTCPASYSYQLGATAPVTISQARPGTGTWNADGSWTGTIPITLLGPLQFSVSATNAVGNPGEAFTEPVTSTSPAPLSDGYFSGGGYPDVLITGTGAKPSLWLSRGTGNGALAPPADIGSLGNSISPGADGPGDWAGAPLILHGDLTGHGVQDVMAYWPRQAKIGAQTILAGTGAVLGGTGAAITTDPSSNFWGSANQWTIAAPSLCDPLLDGCPNPGADEPIDLVAAGNAGQQGTGIADLIGILGDAAHGYELNLYTASVPGGYSVSTDLSGTADPATNNQAPDGAKDWNNYTLGTAQLPDTSNPLGDPSNTVLLALDTVTGALYESANPGCPSNCGAGPLVGSYGTWTQISVPWGSSPPMLVSADVNRGANGPGSGNVELWTLAGATVTAYSLSGTGLVKEGAGSPVTGPSNDWPLTDGSPVLGGTATTAIDTITGSPTGPIAGGYGWSEDPTFDTVVDFSNAGASNGYIPPPPATLSGSPNLPLSISLWFKTTTHDGVLASIQNQALSAGSTIPGGYDPVLYIGNDGRLYGQWWTGSLAPIASSGTVDDGLWHHAVLTAVNEGNGITQTLYIDGTQQGTLDGTIDLSGIGTPTNLTFGAGYIGGAWPNENYYRRNGGTGYADYLNGQIADITISQ